MQDNTRAKILESAEALFAENGFVNTSLRAITQHAGVNLAAVNYHFGSKESLIQHIFNQRLGQLNNERLQLLAELQCQGLDASVESILTAYLAPGLKSEQNSEADEQRFMRLLGRTQMGASAPLRKLVYSLYADVLVKFAAALAQALPDIPVNELRWRLFFLTGTVAYSMSATDIAEFFVGPQSSAENSNTLLLQRLIPFLVAGLKAPAPIIPADE